VVAYNKFNQFVKDFVDGVHDFDAHTFKVMLVSVLPVATNSIKTNLTEISAGNGYSAGGGTTTITTSLATATAKVTGTDVTFTAAGGSIASIRAAPLYNDTPTSPADPLVSFWDYGSAVTLADGESLVVDFDASNGIFQLT
jgi:hypothetical protein